MPSEETVSLAMEEMTSLIGDQKLANRDAQAAVGQPRTVDSIQKIAV